MKIIFRIIADIILLASIFVLPWWISVILFAVSVFLFNFQYEVIVLGFIADAAYGAGSFQATLTLFTAAVLIASIILKPRLKFYEK